MSSLRLGLLVSGVLHAAVVAAFTQVSREPIPAVEQPRPLTLNLSAFQPPPPAPEVRPEVERLPAPVVPEPPPEPVEAVPEPEPEPVDPPPLVKPVEPPPVAKKAAEPRPPPVVKKVAKAKANKPRPVDPVRPVERPVAAAAPVAVAPVVADRPLPVAVAVEERQHYLAALAAQINRSKFYPRASRRLGEEGLVVVHFVIQRNGELTDLQVMESSGSPRLDEAALKTLRRVTPFRPIPGRLGRDEWPISVPISFKLRG
ncbi:MAG: TonB family protein [Chromatiaceae bacterium]|jgi:protein TonB|nr:TonB family protein [Chromatiaceae bacterium]